MPYPYGSGSDERNRFDSDHLVPHTDAVPSTPSDPARADVPDPETYLWVCPNCGERLHKRQCKARCTRCGFFTDCSDTGV